MKKIWNLTKANIRKNKGQSLSLLLFVLIAAVLLNLGLMLFLDFEKSFEKSAREQNSATYAVLEQEVYYEDWQDDYLKDHEGVTAVEKEDAYFLTAEIPFGGGTMVTWLFFLDAEVQREMNAPVLTAGRLPEASSEVAVPSLMNLGGGYELGDALSFTSEGKVYRFTIVGFTEEILFGSSLTSMFRAFLSPAGFKALGEKNPQSAAVVLTAQTDIADGGTTLSKDFNVEYLHRSAQASVSASTIYTMTYTGAKSTRTYMSTITSLVITAFSMIIVLISLIVIRFRIANSIEESMTNLGALKATGYTSRQLLGGILLQFGSVALVAAACGIGLSYALLPFVSKAMGNETAILWEPGFNAAISLPVAAGLLAVVLLVAAVSGARIRKLEPLEALRGGLMAHSFKRNFFPLDKAHGPLNLLLALKTTLRSKARMVMIALIMTAVSFASVAGISIYYNLGVDADGFAKLVSGELPDAQLVVADTDRTAEILADVKKYEGVRSAYSQKDALFLVEDVLVQTFATADFSLYEGPMLYEGRYPEYDNEIAIGGNLSDMLDREIGDTVKVGQGDREREYLITGYVQAANMDGLIGCLTLDGQKRVDPSLRPDEINVYFTDPAMSADFIKQVEKDYPDAFTTLIDIGPLVEGSLSVYGTIFGGVAVAVLVVTFFVILLVLYLVLRTVILRRRRTLGIEKAVGYTTRQLKRQISLHVMPAILVGIAAGGTIGMLGFNSIFLALTKAMGIRNASLPAPVLPSILLSIALVIVSYLVAMLVSGRIKKIDPYRLITE